MNSMAQESGFRITGRMVFFGLVAFFGVVAAVNGVFMYYALGTFPGLTDDEAYKHGLAYNRTLADGERQAALGWTTRIEPKDGTLVLTVLGKDGTPITGATVIADIQRPIGPRDDAKLTFEAAGDGTYRVPFAAPLQGRWKVDVTVTAGADSFRAVHEVMIGK